MSSSPILSGVCVAQSLLFCVVFCRSFLSFCPFPVCVPIRYLHTFLKRILQIIFTSRKSFDTSKWIIYCTYILNFVTLYKSNYFCHICTQQSQYLMFCRYVIIVWCLRFLYQHGMLCRFVRIVPCLMFLYQLDMY